MSHVLAYDLGGTKVAAAIVDQEGRIVLTKKEKVTPELGFPNLFDQMARIGKELTAQHPVQVAGIASAGPLDAREGTLLDPTNFKTQGQTWGVVHIVKEMSARLPLKFRLENDAASAALAEHWVGEGRGSHDMAAVTLGTGLGVGVVANDQLIRAGRFLHTEAGHMIIGQDSKYALCGCGNYGCAEAYLSGVNFTKLMGKSWDMPSLTGEELLSLAQKNDARAIAAFTTYGDRLATFMHNLVMVFAPEVIVLSGGFSHAADLFLPQTHRSLEKRMARHREGVDMLPKIRISKFRDEAGLIGAAKVAHSII